MCIGMVVPGLLFTFSLFSQVQTVELPDPGFENRIKEAVNQIRIIDTHEHLRSEESMLEQKETEPVDFTHLFQHYIIDDLISTGGSLVEGAAALKEKGALDICACIVHPVLANPAVERVENSVLTELVVSNSIPVPKNSRNGKIKVLSAAPILAEAIRRINNDESVSTLFANAEVEG